MKVETLRRLFLCAPLAIGVWGGASQAWATPATTSTTLAMSSNHNSIAPGGSIPLGREITLTATVNSGVTSVSQGQVKFCDATAATCTDIHLLGTAQIIETGPSAGLAIFRFHPGIGDHSYDAVFVGAPNGATAYASSKSSAVALTVTGIFPTKTTLAGSGSLGNYSLTATVTGLVNASTFAAPSGMVSFPDGDNGNISLGSATLGTGTTQLSFLSFSETPTGALATTFMTMGDLNEDGIPDVVAVNEDNDTVTILLGNGSGTFTEAENSPLRVGFGPNSAAVGDLNGDGKADLAIANAVSSSVTILLGNGDGTFAQAADSPVPAGIGSLSLTEGDFNEDGILDLAVANEGDGTVTILLGNGNGTLRQAGNNPIPVGGDPVFVTTGDFNEDGILDLAVANSSSNNLTILLGTGDGAFTQAANSPVSVGDSPVSIAVSDFNGDGIPDLAVANHGQVSNTSGTVSILLGSGDGRFAQAPGSPVSVGMTPTSVGVGDFNGDRKADLAVSKEHDNTVTILLSSGDGTFAQAAGSPVNTARFPLSVAVADFNGDGLVDIAAVDTDLNDTLCQVTVLLSQLTQSSVATTTGISPVGSGTHLVAADYLGDTIYDSSTSQAIGLTASPSRSFTISGLAIKVVRGATIGNTSTITVTPSGGFTGTVNLSCTITPQAPSDPATCSLPHSVTIIGASAQTAVLTVNTTAAKAALNRKTALFWPPTGGTALAIVLLVGVPAHRRNWRNTLGLLVMLTFFACGMTSCGGGSGAVTSGGGGNPGTSAGSYTINITGTSGAVTKTEKVSLTVQ